jgi:uncharacterized membrane protein YciS (DUF1049 family)
MFYLQNSIAFLRFDMSIAHHFKFFYGNKYSYYRRFPTLRKILPKSNQFQDTKMLYVIIGSKYDRRLILVIMVIKILPHTCSMNDQIMVLEYLVRVQEVEYSYKYRISIFMHVRGGLLCWLCTVWMFLVKNGTRYLYKYRTSTSSRHLRVPALKFYGSIRKIHPQSYLLHW